MRFARYIRLGSSLTLLLVLIGACGSAAQTPSPVAQSSTSAAPSAGSPSASAAASSAPTATTAPSATVAPTATTAPSATAAATPSPTTPARVLEDKWYVDGDGNAVPDFVETELGYDPATIDCPLTTCQDAAQGDELLRDRNTLLMLDSSGSMAADAFGERKIDAAKGALQRYVDGAAGLTNLGFLVYGHKGNNTEAGRPESCAGIDVLAPIGQITRETFPGVLQQFEPTGWTPIAAALLTAGDTFTNTTSALNRIIMVSDGIETCDGDPIAVAQELHSRDVAVTIDVIGFDIQESDAQTQLREIANVTGGTYTEARSRAELDAYFQAQLKALLDTYDALQCELGNAFEAAGCNQILTLNASRYISDQAAKVDPASPEYQAYQQLITDIGAANTAFQAQANEAGPRYSRILERVEELRRQLAGSS